MARLKKNAVYFVIKTHKTGYRKKGISKVLKDQIIELEYYPENENGGKQYKIKKAIRLRKVVYQDEKNRYFEFFTNNFEITAEEVVFLYKKR